MRGFLSLLVIAGLLGTILLPSPLQATESINVHEMGGRICIAPLPKGAKEADHDYPDGRAPREYSYEFTIQVDERPPVSVPADDPVVIAGLDNSEKHLVEIRDGDQLIESFWFTFAKRGAGDLWLTYTPWYQTWSLEPARPGGKRCIFVKASK